MISASILVFSLLNLLRVTQAAQSAVKLVVESESSEIDTYGIGSRHEGAGISYFFIGTTSDSEDLTYDDSTQKLTSDRFGQYPSWVGFTGEIQLLQLAVMETEDLYGFDSDNYLLLNGAIPGLWACKNINDPYRYSESSYAILKTKANDDCLSLKLKNSVGGSSGGSSSSSVTVSSSGSITSSVSKPSSVSESFSGYNSTSSELSGTKSLSSSKTSETGAPSVTQQENAAGALAFQSIGLTSLLSFIAMFFF
ncbi:uncharacterized protein ASCRUDRAFT_77734 [Ascoidea rubescens DSM 1968]|uniref:Uncharacterized protein n=1 Tax=Ascoidea rubescens DSM 1968 TaxID=1344418 RepID=A0A1D2VAW8_9ASCO|nr:hypothetical protein ASCRUDRAFT_77734 [Ascoidea rubescens DSM 1968]ODV58735.1 hypothetical protein ASCRUDRAFT_77734 [Ascoidea rubescens DSM 1968]